MNCCSQESCYEVSYHSDRNFFTREEKIEMLKDYHKKLQSEAKGVEERISSLEKHKENDD